jgi:formate C-acetyltransferase
MNLLKVLELTLNNGKDPLTGIQLSGNRNDKDLGKFRSFADLISAYKKQVKFYIRLLVTGINCVAKAFAELAPCAYASALTDDCIERGLDIEWGGGRYNSAGMLQVGTSNSGNSLAALKRTLFEDKTLSPEQIEHALDCNFADDASDPTGEKIRRILLDVPKYGNDDDFADLLVKEVFEFAAKEIANYRVWTTGARCTTEEGHVTAHIALGKLCGATPDGRRAGTPVNEGLSPVQGSDVKGPTAALKSVAKLDHTLCAGGTLLNQKFSPVLFESSEQVRKLAALLRSYFSLGGMHIQCNVVSADVLSDAQEHPENYPNLLIRIAGYSAFFTSLERAIQDEIISRSEQRFS